MNCYGEAELQAAESLVSAAGDMARHAGAIRQRIQGDQRAKERREELAREDEEAQERFSALLRCVLVAMELREGVWGRGAMVIDAKSGLRSWGSGWGGAGAAGRAAQVRVSRAGGGQEKEVRESIVWPPVILPPPRFLPSPGASTT